MELNKLFEHLIEKTNNLEKFSIFFNKDTDFYSISFDNYKINMEFSRNNCNMNFKIILYFNNDSNGWYIDSYQIDSKIYQILLYKFNRKINELNQIETKKWLNKKKVIERKIKIEKL